MNHSEIKDLLNMGFSPADIMVLVKSDNPADPAPADPAPAAHASASAATAAPATAAPASNNLQQNTKLIENNLAQNNTGIDTASLNTFNNNIVNLTKALQASNLLTSYMPAPQGTSEDIANSALASIINPTYSNGGGNNGK